MTKVYLNGNYIDEDKARNFANGQRLSVWRWNIRGNSHL